MTQNNKYCPQRQALPNGSLQEETLKNGIRNAKNFLAKQTWASKTWQERLLEKEHIQYFEQNGFAYYTFNNSTLEIVCEVYYTRNFDHQATL
jgi:hypothetical protein